MAESVNIMNPDKLSDATKSVADTTNTALQLIDKVTNTNLAKNISTALDGLFLAGFGSLVELGVVNEEKVQIIKQASLANIEAISPDKKTLDNKMQILKDIEELRFQIDDETITQLFINLISNSFNSDYNDDISPLFAQILGNMSHKTAVFLNEWQRIPTEMSPYTNIMRVNPDGSRSRIHHSIVAYSDGISRPYDDRFDDPAEGIIIREAPIEISELEYFGIIKVQEYRAPKYADDMYEAISKKYNANRNGSAKKAPYDQMKLESWIEDKEYSNNVVFSSGMIELTPLGKMLCNIIFNLHH